MIEDLDGEDLEVEVQCRECYEFFDESEPHILIREKYDSTCVEEYHLCEDCQLTKLHSDDYVIDTDNNKQKCPECGSDAIDLIPFVGEEFTGLHFLCNGCRIMQQFEYEVNFDE